MTDLTVVNRASTSLRCDVQKFNVKINNNIEITNYNPNERAQSKAGDIKVKIYDGKKDISLMNNDETQIIKDLGTFDLSPQKYTIFKKLVELDGDSSNLSEKDLAAAKSLIGQDNIVNVRSDAKAGVTTIVLKGGDIFRFDIETKEEKETKAAEEAKKAAEAEKQQKTNGSQQQEQPFYQKFWNWLVG